MTPEPHCVEGCDAEVMHQVTNMRNIKYACMDPTHLGQVVLDAFAASTPGRFSGKQFVMVNQALDI